MRVGLTGASGLIGGALAAALAERGDAVVALVRPTSRPTGLDTIAWDPAGSGLTPGGAAALGSLDAVVNLAGAGIGDRRWTRTRRAAILDSRVGPTQRLVEVLAARGASTHLVSASAIGFYGPRGDEVLDETSGAGGGFLADVCRAWEAAAHAYADAGGTVATLRTGIVLDARGGALARQLPLFRRGLGGRLGPGTQWVSPISLDDEVRAILHLLDHRLAGPVNAVAPEPTKNAELTRVLARALRRPAALAVPRLALRAALGRSMADELVLSSQRVVPRALEASGFSHRHPTVDAIVHAALS